MSTFVVNFMEDTDRGFRGRVRHVGSGEEASFSSQKDLLDFFEEMALCAELSDLDAMENTRYKPDHDDNRNER